jgi:hypothetical protein
VIAALAMLLLLGLYARRVYCDSPASITRIEHDGAIIEKQSFVCGWFSLD